MKNLLIKFYSDESGAVTVDWVVLTAAIVGLSLAAMAAVGDGVETVSGNVDDRLMSQLISTSF